MDTRHFRQFSTRTSLRVLLILPTLCLLTIGVSWAQDSGIQGHVSDPTGAFIPGAEVTVANVDTGIDRLALTNDVGFYTVSLLKEGDYQITCKMSGFSTQQTTLHIEVGQIARHDFQLQVGEVTEVVNVVSGTERIQHKAQDVGQVIEERRIRELPLNGRNYLQLAQLSAGVEPATATSGNQRTSENGGFRAVGSQVAQNNIRIDGSDVTSRTSRGQLGWEAAVVTPGLEALSEFKVVTNNVSAEHGYRMGAKVIVSTKSGSNDFHGSVFYYHRNDALAANTFFANKAGSERPKYLRHQFGGAIGGPIIKDRTFFFFNYQGERTHRGQNSSTITVPSAELKNGNFDNWGDPNRRNVFDPLTIVGSGLEAQRQQFPNNQIPTDRFDSIAESIMDLYPAPNISGRENSTLNYIFSPNLDNEADQFDVRIDHTFNDAHSIFGRYSLRDSLQKEAGPFQLPANEDQGQITKIDVHNLATTYNWTINSMMTNEFRFAHTRAPTALDIPATENLNDQFGLKGYIGSDFGQHDRGMAVINVVGFANQGSRCCWPNDDKLKIFDVGDNVLWEMGSHSLKFGGAYQWLNRKSLSARANRGGFTHNGVYTSEFPNVVGSRNATGNGVADLLLGWASGMDSRSPAGENSLLKYYALYIQDDWRLTPNFTLNLGLRWEFFDGPYYPDLENQVASRPVFVDDPNYESFKDEISEVLTPNAFSHFAFPKEGETGGNRDLNNFAPRIGLAYRLADKTVLRAGGGIFYGSFNYIGIDDGRFYAQAPAVRGVPSNPDLINPVTTLAEGLPPLPPPADPDVLPRGQWLTLVPRDLFAPYSGQWFLDIQHMLPWDTLLTVGYHGNASSRVPLDARILVAAATPSPIGTAFGRRRWTGEGSANGASLYNNDSNANYNALSVKAERRFSAGLTFLSSFTWGKNIDYGKEILSTGGGGRASQHLKDRWMDRAENYMSRKFNFNLSFLYELPFGQGKRYLNQAGPADWILGGWQLGTIFNARSGTPTGSNVRGQTYNNWGTHRGDQVGEPLLPKSERSIDRWFNTEFAVPAQDGVFANVGRNRLRGPGWVNWDFLVSKNFHMPFEGQYVQFRFEAFNFTNSAHFGSPFNSIGHVNAGKITSTVGDARLIQFALRYIF